MKECPHCETAVSADHLTNHIIKTHGPPIQSSNPQHESLPPQSQPSPANSRLSRRATLAILGGGIAGGAIGISGSAAGQSATQITDWDELDSELRDTDPSDEFVLANDLDENTAGYKGVVDPNGDTFAPIPDFEGTLDGQGNEIADLIIDRSDPVGLFENITSDGEINDLSFASADIKNQGGDFNGGGILAGKNDGTITNVSANGTVVTEGFDTGGMVGINTGTIEDSEAHVALNEPQNPSNVAQIGGLVGAQQDGGTIENCFATGDVSIGTDDRIGGLVGSNGQFGVAEIIDSYATGDVKGNDSVGGLAGDVQSTDSVITGSYATGDVTGDGGEIGGLIGDIFRGDTIENSYATGNVTGTDGADGLGGFVGTVSDADVTISNSSASGAVTGNSESNQVGGFVGSNEGATVTASFAEGDVTGTDNIGGFVGENVPPSSGSSLIQKSAATGTIEGETTVGGFVGFNEETIKDCYAIGAVTGTDIVGGLCGQEGAFETIRRCYAAGAVSAEGNEPTVGGLVGQNSGIVEDSYFDRDATGQQSGTGGLAPVSVGNGGATGLPTAEMQGVTPTNEGEDTMAPFAFDRDEDTSTWVAVVAGEQINPTPAEDGYPILQGLDAGDQLNAQDIDEDDPGIGRFEVTAITDETPTEVAVNEAFSVQYTVENVGDGSDRQGIRLELDGQQVATKPDTLTPGQSVTNSFTDVTLPDGVEAGETVELTVRTNNDAASTTLTVTAGDNSAPTPDPSAPPTEYAPVGDPAVNNQGVTTAIADWQAGDLDNTAIVEIVQAWQTN